MIRREADSLGDKEDLLSALLGNDLSANAAAAVPHGGVGEKETSNPSCGVVGAPAGGKEGCARVYRWHFPISPWEQYVTSKCVARAQTSYEVLVPTRQATNHSVCSFEYQFCII